MSVTAMGASDDATSQSSAASIKTLSWISGHWMQERPNAVLEEIWSEPTGDSMMGMFRWMKNGKVWIYEILTIREEQGTLVMRFRHFSDALSAWEPKEEPITYQLVKTSDRVAIFENPNSEKMRQFKFELDGEDMVVSVGAFRNGKISSSVFRYKRK